LVVPCWRPIYTPSFSSGAWGGKQGRSHEIPRDSAGVLGRALQRLAIVLSKVPRSDYRSDPVAACQHERNSPLVDVRSMRPRVSHHCALAAFVRRMRGRGRRRGARAAATTAFASMEFPTRPGHPLTIRPCATRRGAMLSIHPLTRPTPCRRPACRWPMALRAPAEIDRLRSIGGGDSRPGRRRRGVDGTRTDGGDRVSNLLPLVTPS
jgi:hypothetical protein